MFCETAKFAFRFIRADTDLTRTRSAEGAENLLTEMKRAGSELP